MKPVLPNGKDLKSRQFKKIELARPKESSGACTPGAGADPDAPPC